MTTPSGGARSLHGYVTRQIALCSLPLVMLAIYLAVDSVMTAMVDRDRAAVNLMENVAVTIDLGLASRVNGLQMLAASAVADDPRRAGELYDAAHAFQRNFGGNVILTDTALNPRFNTDVPFGVPPPPLPRPGEHTAASAGLETGYAAGSAAVEAGQPAIGDAVVCPIAGQQVVAVAVPVLRDGKAVALLLNVIETGQFQGRLNQAALPAGWSLELRDGQGDVIARRAPPHFDSIADVDESGRYLRASRLSPWSVVLEIPRSAQRTPLYAAALALLMAVAGATVVSILGGQFVSRRLGRAVAALADPAVSAPAPSEFVEIAAARRTLDDIEGRRAAAEAVLQHSEQRFRKLFHQAPLALCFASKDGVMLDLNARFVELFGYTAAELPTMAEWWSRAYPDPAYRAWVVRQRELAKARAVRGEGDPASAEIHVTCKDGTVRTVVISSIVLGEDFLASFFDVTERNRAEALLHATQAAALNEQRQARLAALNLMEDAVDARARTEAALVALRESEERLSHALAATEEAVWDYDVASRRVTYNRRWFEMLGLPDNVLVHPIEFTLGQIHADDLDMVRARIAAAWQGDGRYAAEYRLRHADGRILWVSDHGRVVGRAADGRALRMVGACADVTQRRRIEAERYALSEALRQSTQPLLLVDQGFRVTYLNPAFTRLFGDRQEDLTGALVTALLAPNEAGRAEHVEIRRRIDEVGNWSGETHRLARDGTMIPVFASVAQIRDAAGNPAGFVSSYLDLRPLLEKEERLAHSAKLATVGEFAAGLAHELAHPVAVIRLAAECALDHSLASATRDDFLHEQIELVDDQAKRMALQIEHIRAFSRKGDAPDQTFTPQAVVATVVRMIGRQLDIDAIALIERTCGTVMPLRGNPVRLEEVILNLISNARAAILARRAAAQFQGEIVLACDCRGDRVLLTVHDNGVGVAATARDRVFEPFFTTKGVGEGLGLGLSISSTIVKSFGGELSFTSEAGRTIFSVIIPTINRIHHG